jgi:hypothetical protein
MALNEKQRWALECFFPGLVAKLEALGPGEFEPMLPVFKPRGEGIGSADLRVTYFIEGADRMYVELHIQLKLDPDSAPFDPKDGVIDLSQWSRSYYALGYQKRQGSRVFAFDFNKVRHVHMQPDVKEHVPVDETDPDTCDMDPRTFVDMVAKYRGDGVYPVTRLLKKRKKL